MSMFFKPRARFFRMNLVFPAFFAIAPRRFEGLDAEDSSP
jgi:hypothetical protein